MFNDLSRANSQSIAEFILYGGDDYRGAVDHRMFSERYRDYEKELYAVIKPLGEEMQDNIHAAHSKLFDLHTEMGIKAGVMLAISLELSKNHSPEKE